MFELIYSPVHDPEGCPLCGQMGHAIIEYAGMPIIACKGIPEGPPWIISEGGHLCGMDNDTLARRAIASGA